MAVYVPDSTRRRNTALLVAVGLVAGVVLGLLVGRATAPDDTSVADVREQAFDAVAALQRLPIEYGQAVAGEGGESADTIAGAIDQARGQLEGAWEDASWFGPAVREPVDDALEDLDAGVASGATEDEFEALVASAVDAVEGAFGSSR